MNGVHMDQEVQSEVVFLIEATAMNGTHINELKSNYITQILEYFNQGPLATDGFFNENKNCSYTIILYYASDVYPKPCTRAYPSENDPQIISSLIDNIKFVGGKTQATANIGEGLATCLQFFDDIKPRMKENCQKYCILICNSPPSYIPITDNEQYEGKTVEQLTSLLNERKIFLSIISPRKLSALVKLYDNAGGEVNLALNKSYSKNTRNLILINGICLKEKSASPTNVPPIGLPNAMSPKAIPTDGSPNTTFRPSLSQQVNVPVQHPNVDISSGQPMQNTQQQPQPSAMPQVNQTNQQPQPSLPHQAQQPQTSVSQIQNNPQLMMQQQLQQPHNPSVMVQSQIRQVAVVPPNLNYTRLPSQPPSQQQPPPNWPMNQRVIVPAQSALLTQLSTPPSANPPMFSQRYDNPNQSILSQQFQQNSSQPRPPGSQLPKQHTHPDRNLIIWQGILDWNEKTKTPEASTVPRQLQCTIQLTNRYKLNPDIKPETWPSRLPLQLLPRNLLIQSSQEYLKDSCSVCFSFEGDSLESFKQMLANGFAGCIQFSNSNQHQQQSMGPNGDYKIIILLYIADKGLYVGFIPNKQNEFMDNLRKQIQMRRNHPSSVPNNMQLPNHGQNMTPPVRVQNPSMQQQQQAPPQPPPHIVQQGSMPIRHSDVEPGQIMTVTNSNQQSQMINRGPNPMNANQIRQNVMQQQSNLSQRVPPGSAGNNPDINRQQNLANIQLLQQQLHACRQQEQYYQQTGIEVQPQYIRGQIVNTHGGPTPQHQGQRMSTPQGNQEFSQSQDSNFDFLS